MIKRKILNPILISVILIIIIFLLMSYLGYFKGQNANVSRLYYADNISSAHAELIKRFNLKYKGQIEVIPINLPFSKFSTNERKELLARSLRSKSDLIDVFAVDLIWAPRFAKWCLPLDLYFDSKYLKQIVPNALQSCYYEGQLVAMPLYTDIGLLYYREDLIKKFPNYRELEEKLKKSITWEELLSLGQRASNLRDPFYIYQAKNYEGLVCNFFELLACQSGSILKGDSIELNTPEAHKAVQFLVDLVNKYKLSPPVVTTFDEYQSYIYTLDNDAVFLRGWPGFSMHYLNAVRDTSKFKFIKTAAIPHFKGTKPSAVLGGWNLMISKHSTKKWDAIKFLYFALEEENQKMLYLEGGYTPVNIAVYQDSQFINNHKELAYYKELMKDGFHRPYMADYTKISDIISYYVHLAIKNQISTTEALKKATRLINSNKFVIN